MSLHNMKLNCWRKDYIYICCYSPDLDILRLYISSQMLSNNITTTKEHAINLSILIKVDIGLCGRLECHECDYPLLSCTLHLTG